MYNYKSLMSNVLSTILSWCECERKQIEYDPETIEVLKAIYRETEPESEGEEYEETDSEDSDYEPTSDVDSSTEEESSDEESETVSEELIVRKDIKNGFFWLF